MARHGGLPGTESAFNPLTGRDLLALLVAPKWRRDPYALYERLRGAGSVYNTSLGVTTVTSFDAAVEVLRDPSMSSDPGNADLGYYAGRRGSGLLAELPGRFVLRRGEDRRCSQRPFARLRRSLLTHLDGERHRRVRDVAAASFTPALVRRAVPVTERFAHDLLDRLGHEARADLMTAFAYPLPLLVTMELLGVPQADQQTFRSWAIDLLAAFDQRGLGAEKALRRGDLAAVGLQAYVAALVAQRREEPRDDMLSAFARNDTGDSPLSPDELTALVAVIIAAGHETTAYLIGNSVWTLHQNLASRQRFVEEPDIGRAAIDELLRYESPVQLVRRVATSEVRYGDAVIPAGRPVVVLLGAANRDPAHFHNPARLDLVRRGPHPLAYGFGPHHCLGAALAGAEAHIALRVLYERLPGLRPLEHRAQWRASIVFRGLEALPVTW